MDKKSEYQKTIDNLQLQIEEKSKDLQKESEKYDALISNKLLLNKRINDLSDEITARHSVIEKLDIEIEKKRVEIKEKNKQKRKTLSIASEIELLSSLQEYQKRACRS